MLRILIEFGHIDLAPYSDILRIVGIVLAGMLAVAVGQLRAWRHWQAGGRNPALLKSGGIVLAVAALMAALTMAGLGPEPRLAGYFLAVGAGFFLGSAMAFRSYTRLAGKVAQTETEPSLEQLSRLTLCSPRCLSILTAPLLLLVAGLVLLDMIGFQVSFRVFGYGLMLVLGFLSAIGLAQWRARRMGEDGDAIAVCGMLALVGGVVGSRIAYVIENWQRFGQADNVLFEVVNVTSGGLIYYGGLLLASVMVLAYLFLRRLPVRRYLDIVAVSLMVGLAFGRAGCLLNGCCWGGQCRDDWALSTRFPMYSRPLVDFGKEAGPYSPAAGAAPAYMDEYEHGRIRPDDRLLLPPPAGGLLPVEDLHGPLDSNQLTTMHLPVGRAEKRFAKLAGSDGMVDEAEWRAGLGDPNGFLRGSEAWSDAIRFAPRPQDKALGFEGAWQYLRDRRLRLVARFRGDPNQRHLTPEQLQEANRWLQADLYVLAGEQKSLPLRPAQLLGMISALLLAALLAGFFRYRRREGEVFAALMVLYPITRFILESIRADNTHNLRQWAWTHNQVSSAAIALAGVLFWLILYRLAPSAGPTRRQRMRAAAANAAPTSGAGVSGNRKRSNRGRS